MALADDSIDELNLAYLDAQLRLLRLRLGEIAGGASDSAAERVELEAWVERLRREEQRPGERLRLVRIAQAFQLNEFERQLLLLAASPDLDEGFAATIGELQGNVSAWPSVALAWRLFCRSTRECARSRESFRADAPLFRFELLYERNGDAPLPDRLMQIDRRVADDLVGHRQPDARVIACLHRDAAPDAAPCAGVEHLAGCVRRFLADADRSDRALVVNLHGRSEGDLVRLASEAAGRVGLPLLAVPAALLASAPRVALVRESVLLPSILLLGIADFGGRAGGDWARLVADAGPVVFVASRLPLRCPPALRSARWVSIAVPQPIAAERAAMWTRLTADLPIAANAPGDLADTFDVSERDIAHACRLARHAAWFDERRPEVADFRRACEAEVTHDMRRLAHELTPSASWDDLLLPDESAAKLRELCAQVRVQRHVLDEFGFRDRLTRGRGVSALLAGPSGGGKTTACEAIAKDLGRQLYKVDLSKVVSKYQGSTERRLRRVFEEAERARCVVVFDEGEALYTRRTDVRDSRDRLANLQVSYLLQLMEATEFAVVLLATNRRELVDEAFMRRFRFVIEFPMPTTELRAQLWRRTFPPSAPVRGVRFDVLAERLPLSGASIRNIAVAAACLAASDGGVITPAVLAHATMRELEKLGRPAPISETDLSAPAGAATCGIGAAS